MAKLPRVTNKLFAENAATDDIGQFGSANAGTKLNTSDVTTIQALPAWKEGWKPAVVGNNRYPAMQERNGVDKVFSYQIDYMLQQGIPEYDAGTTYYKGSIIKSLDTESKPVLYNSLIDNNVGNPLSDGTKWEKLSFGGGLEVCDIGMSLFVDETKGLRRRLNGQIVDINTNTQGFLTRLKQITTLYPSLLCTEEEWQTIKSASKLGQCGKFVFNYSGAEIVSVRIPVVVNINGLADMANAGLIKDESLPNIVGTVGNIAFVNNARNFTGCFYQNAYFGYTGAGYQYQGQTSGIVNVGIKASLSSSTYQDNAHVQQEAIQYPYFIQIATGQETENNIVNDIELNNPYSLFDHKYSDHELNNLSWLKSEAQWNAKTVYTDAYDKLLKVYNGTEIVEGLSVKLSTETYTDYDFVLNTSDETFRLPLKTKLASGKAIVGNGMTLGLTNGTANGGLAGYSNGSTNANIAYKATYGVTVGNTITGTNVTASLGVTTDPTKSGIELSDSDLYLYFYVGETVQNANLIDAGRMQEQITNINVPSRGYLVQSYVNGTSGYRVYSDGWCEQWGRITVGSDAFVSVTFLKPFMNASYYANWISCNGETQKGEGTRACDNLTTTSMRIYNGQDCAMLANWYACGY